MPTSGLSLLASDRSNDTQMATEMEQDDSMQGLTPPSTPIPRDTEMSDDQAAELLRPKQFSNLRVRDVFGKRMSTVMMGGKEYLIGVQIAHFLKRETFNLYRSMKLSNVEIVKCQAEEIEELTQMDAIKRGIHSVTLVPFEGGLIYIGKELKRKPRKKSDKRPRLHLPESPRGSPYMRPHRAARQSSPSWEESDESDSEETAESASCADDDTHQTDTSRQMHWKKLLLVASLEHMKMSEITVGC